MLTSTNALAHLLEALTRAARQLGWSDAEWARRSGLPKETLCRLRSRSTCDLATLEALSRAVGSRLTLDEPRERTSADELWPAVVDRRRYLDLAEALHPGATEPRVFAKWLEETPLPPDRFLPMLRARFDHAA